MEEGEGKRKKRVKGKRSGKKIEIGSGGRGGEERNWSEGKM